MLAAIVTAIGTSFSSIITALANGVGVTMSMFWDATANTGAGALTPLGDLCVAGLILTLAVTVVYKVFDLVTGFFKLRG